MSLQLIAPKLKETLLQHYRDQQHFFPLITSVLSDIQDGVIYSDGKHANYFIIHKFGFADLIETEESTEFDAALYDFFLEKNFLMAKIRWYNVPEKWMNKFKLSQNNHIQLAERVQLKKLSSATVNIDISDETIWIEEISTANILLTETNFKLALGSRFWSSEQHFLKNSLGVVVYKDNTPAALCYACALVDGIAEVDVFTHEVFRKQGLGKLAVAQFINICAEKSVQVHWDCYTNNTASFLLAQSLYFEPYHVYSHAIISK